MPVYLYRNLTTNDTFEYEQRITEPALTVHPTTGDPVKRLIQPVGIAFKGSGFYVNDSRSSNSASKSSKSESKSGDKSESKGDSKPESKSEGKSESKTEKKTEGKSSSSS